MHIVKQRKGFTIVEILVTLAIIGILAAVLPITFSKQSSDKKLKQAEKVVQGWVESARTIARSRQATTELAINENGLAVRYQEPENLSIWVRVKENEKGFESSSEVYRFNAKGICVNNERPIIVSQDNEAKRLIYILQLNGVRVLEHTRVHPH